HRAHTVFVGVHVPARRHSHRKHKHHHRNGEKDVERPVTPPAQRVQFILGEDVDDSTLESHPLFSEMEELVKEGDELEWKETARWIKFEEDVEEGGNRWSKPHVATLSLHSLFELRSLILNGSVILDMEANCLEQVADNVLDNMVADGGIGYDCREKVKDALLRRHRHQHERRNHHNNMSRLPLIRSLADIGRNHSSCKNFQEGGSRRSSSRSCRGSTSSPHTALLQASDARGSYLAVPGAAHDEGMVKSPSSISMQRNHSSGDLPMNGDINHKCNTNFMRKIPPGAEASNILVGEVDFLEKTLSAFVRLKTGTIMGDLTEVPVPTRFMFVLLGPPNSNSSFHEIGRAMATLMSDEIFHEVAYRAKKRDHLLAGIDEFLDAVTVLPPGEWDPAIRIEPPAAIPSQDPRKRPNDNHPKEELDEEEEEQRQREESGLARSGRLFGGLINDLKRKMPWYWSDFKDALAIQCVASWIFLYFACLSPIITFGGLLGEATGKNMAAMESLISGFVCGMGYGFFSGQPLTILGSTGPVLVFETIVFEFCRQIGWNYMSFRFCIGTWITIILVILVAIDASAFVCYITRFTEENFATLIAFIFIYKVPIRRVHIFTTIQLTCLVCLWVIKSFSMTSILFPLMLVVMIGIRKALDLFFTRREMKILDDVMPEMTKRNQDELRELGDAEEATKSNPPPYQENLQIPLINGNIMNIPLTSINISEEVNKTGIWKQVNNSNKMKKDMKNKTGKKNNKHKKLIMSKNAQTEIERRLSTMDEVEEDDSSTKVCVNDTKF
ncbi:hypothetical protein SFRURICE_021303, partial [Spodoptera frugiperda]